MLLSSAPSNWVDGLCSGHSGMTFETYSQKFFRMSYINLYKLFNMSTFPSKCRGSNELWFISDFRDLIAVPHSDKPLPEGQLAKLAWILLNHPNKFQKLMSSAMDWMHFEPLLTPVFMDITAHQLHVICLVQVAGRGTFEETSAAGGTVWLTSFQWCTESLFTQIQNLGGGFTDFLFAPLLTVGDMIQFD